MKHNYVMIRKSIGVMLLWIMALNLGMSGAEKKIELKINKVLEIGKKDLMFASIASVCEDTDSNLYVLDRVEHKVFKFSPEGNLIQSFGQKGQGPGDYQNPHLLAFTPEGQLVVADEMYNLSFMTDEGNFIERIHLDGRLAVGFIGKDRYYAWIWQEDSRCQVMVDKQNKILRTFGQVLKRTFSVSAPDESGRPVMFNYSREEFVPSLQFAHFGRYSAVGIGDKYDISILDEKGKTIIHLRRNVQPGSFRKEEKKYFEKDIKKLGKERGWPGSIVRNLVKKIPDKKIFYDRILLTEEYVFVFRTKKNITRESGPFPVDVFSIKGEFLGAAHVPDKPLYISDKHMFFIRSDKEDNLFLEKAAYKIVKN